VVIDNFNRVRVAVPPHKTDPPLLVDPNAMLASAITFESLQSVLPPVRREAIRYRGDGSRWSALNSRPEHIKQVAEASLRLQVDASSLRELRLRTWAPRESPVIDRFVARKST
jgi:hypothetical protein